MADNTQLNSGSGGDNISTDDLGTVKVQRVKVQYGVDGSATDVSDTNPLPIDDAGGSLTVDQATAANLNMTEANSAAILADTASMDTNLDTIAGAVSGTEMQVDLVSANVTNAGTFAVQATQAGSWTVDLGANNDVTIDNSSMVYTTDAAAPASPVGIPFLMERDDALSALTPVAGDWVQPRCDSQGALWVNAVNAGGTQTDDAAFTPATSTVAVMGAFADETTPDSVDEGDAGALRMTLNRHLKVQPNDFLTPAGDSMVDDTNDALQVNVVAGGGTGGTSSTDDAAFTAASGSGTPIMGFASSDVVDAGDVGVLAMDTSRNLKVSIEADNAGIGGGTQYAEDTAHNTGDTGTMALAVRNDALAALAGTDGDYAPLQVDAAGALYTVSESDVVDSNNSTTSTLTANTDYTGTGTDVLGYSGITVVIFADQDSDVNGMRFEFSTDNSNWDISQTFDYKASTGRQFQFGCQARYFRVAFQNGGTNQTAFRLQTILHRSPVSLPTVHRADADIAIDRSATLVKSILMAQSAGTGDFTPVDATTGGNLKVSLSEASDGLDIGAGNAGTETVRVSIASDDVNLSGILADTASMDTNLGTIAGDTTSLDGKIVTGGGTEAGAVRVTLANDSTGVVTVDDGGSSLTVDGTVAATQSGTWTLGANSGVDIGDVDVTSVVPGTEATNLGKAEDAVHSSGDTGVMALAVRNDDLAALAGTDGDYAPLQVDEFGAAYVTDRAESMYRNIDANAEAAIKASAGTLNWLHCMNLTAAKAYVHLYNATTASVTPGTTTPDLTFPLATSGDTNGAGFTIKLNQYFDTAITIVVTTTVDGSTGDPGTNGVFVNAGYT